MRHLVLGVALLVATPALACPMADASAYQTAVEKVHAASGTKVALVVEGMHCGSCAEKVMAKLSSLPGVTAAASDFQTGSTEVAYDAKKVKTSTMLSAIAELGFKAKIKTT
jgi:copper chaperone CopZ